jgi:16S rRNA (guanine527-N7)-methyltransferase
MNLTGLSSRRRILRDLLLDSIIPSPYLPNAGRLLDVGAGAGFPAIPLKICKPGIEAHLIEAKAKRVSFLKQVIRLTGLGGIDVMEGRIEREGNLLCPEGYHVITARAVAGLPRVLSWCAPHLQRTGLIVNFQGSQFDKAVGESSEVLKEHRLFLYQSIPYTLPGKDSPRHLILFKRHAS